MFLIIMSVRVSVKLS